MAATPRTRPAKPALSRDTIVAAALALVDEDGMEATGMRRVARAVDTGAASLYVYVEDREHLMSAAYDLALAEVGLPVEADGDWRARLELLVRRTVEVLGAHGDIARVGLSGVPTGSNALRVTEEILRLLRSAGIGDAGCAWAVDLLLQYIVSSASEMAARLRAQRTLERTAGPGAAGARAMSDAFSAQLDDVYRSLPVELYPTIGALAPLLTRGDGDARASWKLRVIIDGLLAVDGPS